MNLEHYTNWLAIAKSFVQTQQDAEDLLQECILIAFQKHKLDFNLEDNRKWFTGVLKNRAAMKFRSENRRKNREKSVMAKSTTSQPQDVDIEPPGGISSKLLDTLPPSSRKVMALILSGLNRKEICAALNLSSDALRQHLMVIRKALKKLPEDLQRQAMALAYHRQTSRADDLAFGLIRRALIRLLDIDSGIGTHDPDGHLIIINPK